MTQPSPAEQLRAAAEVLRQHADAAEADVDTNPYWESALTERPDWYANGVRNGLGGPSGEYAALMHPGVGHALAQWLDSWTGIDLYEAGSLPEDARHALAVARAITGDTT